MNKNQVIRFDWAIKNILRDKANFDILEGFLSALLKTDINVIQLLESESNQEEGIKFNRVDLLVEDGDGRKIIIEVQNQREVDYLERILYGTSKTIVENLELGKPYADVSKVISVSILYFNLGKGDDYVYHGKTEFTGIHNHNKLLVRQRIQKDDKILYKEKQNIFPEYYLIQVEKFENEVNEDLDEWIYMFKNSEVKDTFKSKNIDKARTKLNMLSMSSEERKKYERYLENLVRERDIIKSAKDEGIEEGIREEEIRKTHEFVKRLIKMNFSNEQIIEATEILNEEIDKIRNEIKNN